jgi:hypothetical protein
MRRLVVAKETLSELTPEELGGVAAAGGLTSTCTQSYNPVSVDVCTESYGPTHTCPTQYCPTTHTC